MLAWVNLVKIIHSHKEKNTNFSKDTKEIGAQL